MSFNSELYEINHFSGFSAYTSTLATYTLNSNNTGLWLVGETCDLFAGTKLSLKSKLFFYRFFDCADDSNEYNKLVAEYEDKGVLSCAFASKLFVTVKNGYAADVKNDSFNVKGLITLYAEQEDGSVDEIIRIPHLHIPNVYGFAMLFKPLNVTSKCRLTMDSSFLASIYLRDSGYDPTSFQLGITSEEEEAEPKVKATKKSLSTRLTSAFASNKKT